MPIRLSVTPIIQNQLIRADKIPVAGTEVVQAENGLDVHKLQFFSNLVRVNVDRVPNCHQMDTSGSSSSDETVVAVDVSQTVDIIEPESVASTSADCTKQHSEEETTVEKIARIVRKSRRAQRRALKRAEMLARRLAMFERGAKSNSSRKLSECSSDSSRDVISIGDDVGGVVEVEEHDTGTGTVSSKMTKRKMDYWTKVMRSRCGCWCFRKTHEFEVASEF